MTTAAPEKDMAKAKKKTTKETKQDLLEKLSKDFPLFNEDDYVTKVEAIPSGSLALDMAIGIGGYPRGSIIDIFGQEGAGKSLLSILAIAELQKTGGTVVVWDAERSYSKNLEWMRTNGVDTSKIKFLKLRPGQGCEIGMHTIEELVKAQAVDLIVVDSVPALVPQKSLDKDMMDDDIMASTANVLTRHLRRLVGLVDESKTSVMFINQMRANTQRTNPYSPTRKETTIWALKHFAALRLDVRKISKPELRGGMPYSHWVEVNPVKNKVNKPGRKAKFEIIYTEGINRVGEVADILVAGGEVKKQGSWFVYDGTKYHGRNGLLKYLSDKKVFDKALVKAKGLAASLSSFGINPEESEDNEESSDIELK